ncbi:MAG: ArsR/SmtB family transcription factor [Calditerrivibrio sp.]|uniref:ArsR/SmtB family transcription factor n=1 Tax=Calditerrivibrio sp. TaxID=2792612 RepID=UPI003D0A75C6
MELELIEISEEQIEVLCKVFKGISDPTRLKILKLLWNSPKYAYEIESQFDFERSNVAKHLSIMLKLGILKVEKEGNKSRYSVRMTCIPRVIGCLIPYIEDSNYPYNIEEK